MRTLKAKARWVLIFGVLMAMTWASVGNILGTSDVALAKTVAKDLKLKNEDKVVVFDVDKEQATMLQEEIKAAQVNNNDDDDDENGNGNGNGNGNNNGNGNGNGNGDDDDNGMDLGDLGDLTLNQLSIACKIGQHQLDILDTLFETDTADFNIADLFTITMAGVKGASLNKEKLKAFLEVSSGESMDCEVIRSKKNVFLMLLNPMVS